LAQEAVNPATLAETVSRLRLRMGMAVGELAAKSGVPEHLVRAIESADPSVPSEANTVKLALALRVPAAPLLAQRERRARITWQEPPRPTDEQP
jgi:transcriptional regulator with XRE-family HTH domain